MGQMLKSLRKFNKNVFVYVSYPPPLSNHILKEGVIRAVCVDRREGGIKGGDLLDMYACRLTVAHMRGKR